ncbi:cytochrome P450 6a2-like [Schistocerca serialis cubense]|uniref:cytochrome P450 6a2-like n=1 Tax=Schistocerca serialis cubense TaxID=2023355 RepID=UPI00214E633E|nr:cytochrome P450 6a2-like [Schistocerca serialis cubense]
MPESYITSCVQNSYHSVPQQQLGRQQEPKMAIFFDSWVTEMLALLSTIFAILYVTFKINYTYWKKKGLPYLEPSFPLGNGWNTALMRICPGEDTKDVYFETEGKDVVGIETQLIKTIIVKDFNSFPDRGIYVDEETDHLTAHLFFLRGTKWLSLCQKLTPTFTSGKMRAMFGIVRDCARILTDVTPAGSVVEVRELIARYSTDVIDSCCAFGIDVDSQHNPEAEFRQWGGRIFKPSIRSFLTQALGFSNPNLRNLLPIAFTPKDITEYFTRVVDDTIIHREKTGVIRKDFMQLMIQLKNIGYVDDSFLITGQKSVEHKSISQYLLLLFVFPSRIRLQTLRMYPSVPVLNREVVQDYKLPGYDCVLEEGTKVFIPVLGLHHDRKFFRNPEKFDPEHFSEEQKASRHPYCYLPFGEGPRLCIGMRFGLMQVKLALVHLLSKFDFLPVGDKQSKLRMAPNNVVLTPIGGIELRVEHRRMSGR